MDKSLATSLIIAFLVSAPLTMAITVQNAKADDADVSGNSWVRFISCDKNGNEKHTFQPTEDVYVVGGRYPLLKNKEVSINVMPNGQKITDVSKANAIAGPVDQTVNANGHLDITCIWSHPLKMGEYDVWIDVNQNGVFDDGDIFHYYFFFSWYLFHVIPESLIGTVGPLAAMASGLALFYLRKPRRIS